MLVGVAARQQLLGEAEEPLAIVERDADDVGDHVHRQLVRDVLDEVARAALACPLDDRDGPLPRLGLESPHHARGEAGADQTALPNVVASVHA